MKILKAFTDKFPLKTTSKKAWLQLWIFSDLCQDFLPKIKNFWSLRLILKRLRLQTLIKMTILATKILCSINFWQSEVKKHWEGTFQKVLNISERKIQDSSNLTKHSRQEEKLLFLRNLVSHKLTSQKLAQVAPNFPQQMCQEPTHQIRHKG